MQLRGCFLVTGLLLLSRTTAQLEFWVPPFNRTAAVSATQTNQVANQWRAIAFGNHLFVGVGPGSTPVMWSSDGINWQTAMFTDPITGSQSATVLCNQWNGITFGQNLFVAVASDGAKRVITSPDAMTWMPRVAAEANQWRAVTFGNNLFVAVASDGANRVMTSPDTITWTGRAAAEANQWSAITFGNNLFVAVASDGTNRVMSSSDAITWIARAAAEANQWRGLTFG